MPLNADTGRPYNGINRLILWSRSKAEDFHSRHWATFRQWRALRQPVGRGQKGTTLIRPVIHQTSSGKDEVKRFTTFSVFNGDQVLNRDETHPDLFGAEPIESCGVDEFVRATEANVRTGGDRAVYNQTKDSIHIPPPDSFFATRHSTRQQNYYSTLLHELIHWTGHPSRENRVGPYDSALENYAFEELVAELGGAFLCSEFDLEDVPRKDHTQYLNAWLSFIREQPNTLWRAAALAQRAMVHLQQVTQPDPENEKPENNWLTAQPVQSDLLAPM